MSELRAAPLVSAGFNSEAPAKTHKAGWLIVVVLCLAVVHAFSAQAQPGEAPSDEIVQLRIRYHAPEAGQVVMLWGIDGWHRPRSAMVPPHSRFKDQVMTTRLSRNGEFFETTLRVPKGTAIDFGFLNTRKSNGSAIFVWEADGTDDFRHVAERSESIEFNTGVHVSRARIVSPDFEAGLPLLLIVLSLLGLAVVVTRRKDFVLIGDPTPTGFVVLNTIVLSFFLVLIRAHVAGLGWESIGSLPLFLKRSLEVASADLLFAVAAATIFIGLIRLTKGNAGVQHRICLSYVVFSTLVLLVSFVNLKIVITLGRPFNYQWFYYSDFLRSSEARSTLASNLSAPVLLNLACLLAAFALGFRVALIAARRTPLKARRRLAITFAVLFLAYAPIARFNIHRGMWAEFQTANPVVAFVDSWINRHSFPGLAEMALPPDFVGFPNEEVLAPTTEALELIDRARAQDIRNVVLFVLESVPGEYVEAYGSVYAVTPQISARKNGSVLFRNVYAHAPASNKSMFSLLSGMYPWISFNTITAENPEVHVPTITSELKADGYRTAFISSGDLGFQRGDEFLRNRQFDIVVDVDDLSCQREAFASKQWSYLRGTDEPCMVEAFTSWLGSDPTRPFFAQLWTIGTHYPYFTAQDEQSYSTSDKNFNRYLNALREADDAFGRLMRTLEERGLLESTLVVVVGDHGEAFGRHDQTTHASMIYEENLHVPLMLFNPIFRGEELDAVGGHIDVAPTIFDAIGRPAPKPWQGRSFFGPRSTRTYFFAVWSDFLFGYREGDLKYIFNATDNVIEVFDLSNDKQETRNLVDDYPNTIDILTPMAAWIQYHNRLVEDLLRKP